MRNSGVSRLQGWVVVALLAFSLVPIRADWEDASSTVSLNGVALGSDFQAVIAKKGLPDYIGPSVENITDINNILKPSPQPSVAEMESGGMPFGAPGTASAGMMQNSMQEIKVPRGRGSSYIWLYEDKSPAKISTFVVIDRKSGVVTDVIVWQANSEVAAEVPTTTKVNLGTSFADLIDIYGYPKPFRKAGATLICPYLDQSVTYSVNPKNGRIVGITIGRRALTVFDEKADSAEGAGNGGATPPNPMAVPPGAPGGLPAGAPPGMMPGLPGPAAPMRY